MNRYSAMLFALVFATTPALSQEREWSFDSSEDEAFLIFGVPESDDVGVSFWCSLRSGEVRLFVPDASPELKANETTIFTVSVDGKSVEISGKALPNEEAGTMSLEGTVKVNDPLFTMLKTADRFSVTVEGESQTYPLAGADFEMLLQACGKS